jgi:hypothetical protein
MRSANGPVKRRIRGLLRPLTREERAHRQARRDRNRPQLPATRSGATKDAEGMWLVVDANGQQFGKAGTRTLARELAKAGV